MIRPLHLSFFLALGLVMAAPALSEAQESKKFPTHPQSNVQAKRPSQLQAKRQGELQAKTQGMGFDAMIQSLSSPATLTRGNDSTSVSLDLDIHFASGTADLLPQAKSQLATLARALESGTLKGKAFQVVGHTDAEGGAAYNKELSARRAQAVKNHLVRSYGIDGARLRTKGMGEDQLKNPLAPNAITNRRVEITLLGNAQLGVMPSREARGQDTRGQEIPAWLK